MAYDFSPPTLTFSSSIITVCLFQMQKSQGSPTKKLKSKKVDHLKGQKVIARCDENGFYFPGMILPSLSETSLLYNLVLGIRDFNLCLPNNTDIS